jgi:hypothetical protein
MLGYQEEKPEPEPVLAGEDERPIDWGWDAFCQSCNKVTTWRGFTDEHGCEVGAGCTKCRYIPKYRGCEYKRGRRIA